MEFLVQAMWQDLSACNTVSIPSKAGCSAHLAAYRTQQALTITRFSAPYKALCFSRASAVLCEWLIFIYSALHSSFIAVCSSNYVQTRYSLEDQ